MIDPTLLPGSVVALGSARPGTLRTTPSIDVVLKR
jgi:hypothetical protein